MSSIQATQSLGEIATQLPGATAVFRRHKLDFCCGGQQSLDAACTAKQLDPQALIVELTHLQPHDDETPMDASPSVLIDWILQRFHERHRQQLAELIRMATRVEAVHKAHPDVPVGLAAHLETMEQDLLSHMAKEEQILFPMMKRGARGMVNGPIAMMRHEHDDHGLALQTLEQLTHDHQPPAGACNTWRALYLGTRQLQDDLMQHIHLENNLLFPAFEAA